MKIKYLLYAAFGVCIITLAGVVFNITSDKNSKSMGFQPDSTVEEMTEYELVDQALIDPESTIKAHQVVKTTLNENLSSSSSINLPNAVAMAHLPKDAYEKRSQPAPELDVAALDTDIKRIYDSGASLGSDNFKDLRSKENLSVIRALISKSQKTVK